MSTNANPPDCADLRARRLERGLSQQELAHRAACSVSYVALLEKGFTPASSSVLRRIAAVLEDDERRVGSATLGTTSVDKGDRDAPRE